MTRSVSLSNRGILSRSLLPASNMLGGRIWVLQSSARSSARSSTSSMVASMRVWISVGTRWTRVSSACPRRPNAASASNNVSMYENESTPPAPIPLSVMVTELPDAYEAIDDVFF